jgi:hypothetical protein
MKKYALVIIFVAMAASGLLMARVYADSPTAIVGDAFGRLRAAKSFMAAVTIGAFAPESVVRAAGGDPAQVILPVVFVGEMAMNIPADGRPNGTANFVLVGGQDESQDVSVESVIDAEGTSYVRFANVPAEGNAAAVAAELNGKWYSMRTRGLAALLAKDGESTAEEEDPTGRAPREAWARLRSAIADGEVFGKPVPLGVQVLGEVSTRRYQLPLKRDAVSTFMQDVTILVRGRELRADERADIAAAMQKRAATVEVWVDKRTGTLQQVNLDVRGVDEAGQASKVSYFSLLARFTAWDAPVEFETPKESTPFVDMFKKLQGAAAR